MKHQAAAYELRDWQPAYEEANRRGAELFGRMWLTATQNAVATFREAGFGDELERDYRLRAAVANTVYRTLYAAMNSPNAMEIARAKVTRGETETKP